MKAVVLVFAILATACALVECTKNKTNRCTGEKNGTKLVDFDDCHKYILCTSQKEVSKKCGNKDDFDAVTLECVKKASANCFAAPEEVEIPTEEPVPVCNTQFAADCTQYWSCETGAPTLKDCLEGYFYYEPLRSCLPGDAQICELYKV
ncbi:uncharacterized protein LOC134224319 [Armigeres subalbatus]|uniref:uncharacterized protein LOC134224319 n=1 Tax=Armigeres subalbatus TaxID=124917 RepID=UPI002ED5CC69